MVKSEKLIKRGDADISFDDLRNKATIELYNQLDNRELNQKEKDQILISFGQLMEGLENGTIGYNVNGGGFRHNYTSLSNNKNPNKDYAGFAAGIIGKTLRTLDPYDHNADKIKWEGNSSIGKYITQSMFGGSEPNLEYFYNLDYNNDLSKVSGNLNRSQLSKNTFITTRDNFDKIFYGYSPEDYTQAMNDLDVAIKSLEDGKISNNEYLALSRVTGINNIGTWFEDQLESKKESNNSETEGTQGASPAGTPPASPVGVPPASPSYTNEEEWLNIQHPRGNFKPLNRTLDFSTKYSSQALTALSNTVKSSAFNKDRVMKIIAACLGQGKTGYKMQWQISEIKKLYDTYGKGYLFDNNLILRTFLALACKKNWLYKFNGDNYYIPINARELDNENSAIVYQRTPDKKHRVVKMDRYDIPYFRDKWHNEFISIPTHKNGGNIQFLGGGATVKGPVSNVTIANGNDWMNLIYNTDAYTKVLEGIDITNFDKYNDLQNAFSTLGNSSENTVKYSDDVLKYQQNFNNLAGPINSDAIQEAINKGYIKSKGRTGDNANNKWADGYGGKQTNLRHLGTKVYYTDEVKKHMDEILAKKNLISYLNETTGMVNFKPLKTDKVDTSTQTDTTSQTETAQPVGDGTQTQQAGDGTQPDTTKTENTPSGDKKTSIEEWMRLLREAVFGNNKHKMPKTNYFRQFPDWLPDATDVAATFGTIHTNNNNARITDRVLKGVMKETPEWYTPTKGKWSSKSFNNNQGFGINSLAQRPSTSDPNEITARMFQGWSEAGKYFTQGKLEDDAEIRRTGDIDDNNQKEALFGRVNNKFDNDTTINKVNLGKANIETNRQLFNRKSLNNWIQGFGKRWRELIATNRQTANAFLDNIAQRKANKWYTDTIRPAKLALQQWESEHQGVDAVTYWPLWNTYSQFINEAYDRAQDMLSSNLDSRYLYGYKRDYTPSSNNLFTWDRRNFLNFS